MIVITALGRQEQEKQRFKASHPGTQREYEDCLWYVETYHRQTDNQMAANSA